jgi:hypothetical protein
MEPKIVSNVYYGLAGLPLVTAEAGVAADPEQLYRNTDNTIFRPTYMMITSREAAAEILRLVDCDLTDAGIEVTYKAHGNFLLEVNCAANVTTILNENDLPKGLQFLYGIGGWLASAAAATGLSVYVEGYEIPLSTTE